jgi:thymidylate kinase
VSAKAPKGTLIAVDGVNGSAILGAAHAALGAVPRTNRGGISRWDASGLFGELVMAGEQAGRPSARTLLLLYAADLAFRLRWEVLPKLAEGHTVVAVPYVDTAFAFGRAAGIPVGWLSNLFQFAPRPAKHVVQTAAARRHSDRKGFVEFACVRLGSHGHSRRDIIDQTRTHLKTAARRGR